MKLGKVGSTVYGKNRYGQTCYSLVSPLNPRTASQQANRGSFGATGPRWRLLTDDERILWDADARYYRTHGRPGGSAPMTGFQRFMSVNAKRARQGLPPLRVPPLAISSQALAPPAHSHPPRPRRLHRAHTPRVPMRYRSASGAAPLTHRWTPPDPPCVLIHARLGPGPPFGLVFIPNPVRKGHHLTGVTVRFAEVRLRVNPIWP